MAFKKACAWDTGKAMRSIQDSDCIAYMYDESGARLPNKYGKDIIPHGLTITGKGTPIATVSGYKIMEKVFIPPTGLTYAECEAEISKNYGITECYYNDDSWAWSMKYCYDKGYRLAKQTEAKAIVKGLFKDDTGNHPSSTYKIDVNLAHILGFYDITESSVFEEFWAASQNGPSHAYGLTFDKYGLYWNYFGRTISDSNRHPLVLCISDELRLIEDQ